jgi:hypothetical protein
MRCLIEVEVVCRSAHCFRGTFLLAAKQAGVSLCTCRRLSRLLCWRAYSCTRSTRAPVHRISSCGVGAPIAGRSKAPRSRWLLVERMVSCVSWPVSVFGISCLPRWSLHPNIQVLGMYLVCYTIFFKKARPPKKRVHTHQAQGSITITLDQACVTFCCAAFANVVGFVFAVLVSLQNCTMVV